MNLKRLKNFFLIAIIAGITAGVWTIALAQRPSSPVNKTSDGVTLKGYDVVAYFLANQPVKGKSEFTHEWKGAKWQFSSAANRDLFAKNPEKYAPQYGGYCAYGVSKGYAVDVDPEAWKIVDGKLYLNYNKDVAVMWNKDIPGHIKKADLNWPRLLQE